MIFEIWSQFCINLAPFCENLEHKCKIKLKGAHSSESKRVSGGTLPPIGRRVLLTKHFDNSLSVYIFLEFEPQFGKSEKFNNQGMKENKTFRILFITKEQLKGRQALHRIFVKPQYKVCRGASILYFNASFSDVFSFSKLSQPPGQNQQMVLNSVVCHHPCPSRIASRLT